VGLHLGIPLGYRAPALQSLRKGNLPVSHDSEQSDPDAPAERGLPHVRVGPQGSESRMVDVGSKSTSRRQALARARVEFPPGLCERVMQGQGPKGPIEEVARSAGILGAKATGSLIPMCHPLGLDHVQITFEVVDPDTLDVLCSTSCEGRTGVEMEAMLGAGLAALTVYDMTKGLDKGIRLGAVELLEKSGGASGHWTRS